MKRLKSLSTMMPAMLLLGPAWSGCAKGDESPFDYTIDRPIDYVYDPPPADFLPDIPYDPATDTVPDPVPDTVYDVPVDLPVDTVTDTGTCTESPCGLKPNCGCPSGQKCTLDSTGGRTCVPAGSGTTGMLCTSESDCAAGYICLASSADGSTSACYAYYDTDVDCMGDGSICMQLYLGTTPVDGWVCTYDCNLTTGSGCPTGHRCDVFGIDENGDTLADVYFTDCLGGYGTGLQGSYCASDADCSVGYFCYTDMLECLGYCYVGTTTCTSGTTCIDLEITLGSREVGACYY
jgi:hypothetical protein